MLFSTTTSALASSFSSFLFSTFSSVTSSSSFGNNKFRITPITAAKLIPDTVTVPIPIAAPPSPNTSILDAIITFLDFPKSTLFSIKTLSPFTAINPYSSNDTPPSTAFGIVDTSAVNLPKNPSNIANIAASPITQTDAILVIPTTAVFSP